MISLPFRRITRQSTIDALYGMIVAQARAPAFYSSYGVPDTVAGRMDMIVLHLVLLLRQLRAIPDSSAASALSQQVFDRFCEDMDDNFREMGVGDLAVPKEMRRVGEAFYGRASAYDAALAAQDIAALAAALARNVYGRRNLADAPLGARRLAAYMQETATRLSAQTAGALARGEFDFPDPQAVAEPAFPGEDG
jgi:cytochrome b pre-mRNA-processing protein 3